jgi:hypothetical protein
VQSANNVLNTILKDNLIDVVLANTAAELTAGIGNVNKLYATRDNICHTDLTVLCAF